MQRTEEDSYQRLLHRLVQSVRTGSAVLCRGRESRDACPSWSLSIA